jgi:hypothetical protein
MTEIPLSVDDWFDVAIAARIYVDEKKRANAAAIEACNLLDMHHDRIENAGVTRTRADVYGHRSDEQSLVKLGEQVDAALIEIGQRRHTEPQPLTADVHSNGDVHPPANIADSANKPVLLPTEWQHRNVWTVQARGGGGRSDADEWTVWSEWVDRTTAEAEKQHAIDEGYVARIVRAS